MGQPERNDDYRPRIAVSHGRLAPGAAAESRASDPYVVALAGAGARACLTAEALDEAAAAALLAGAAGLLLCGGVDVEPARYGAVRQAYCGPADRRRDEREARLVAAALALDLPILAICRGIQMLDVARGGTLYQDIATELPGSLRHPYIEGTDKAAPVHSVAVAPQSALAAVLGTLAPSVNSRHHQAVRDVAPGFAVVARAPDGVVEAVEMPGRRFVIGVQWHPEDMVDDQAHAAGLFGAFVEAARRYQDAG